MKKNTSTPTAKKEKTVKTKEVSIDELQEQFEDELDIALMYMFEILDKYKKALTTYTDYSGDYENGPSFHVAINTNKTGKIVSADINLELKNLSKFVKDLRN